MNTNFSVTQNGKPLSKDKYTWDEKTKVFSSAEDRLVLDFSGINYVTFNTGSNCTFKTGSHCTFDTGHSCTFKTGKYCVVVRRDVFEIIQLVVNQKIKLNESGVNGFNIIEEKPNLSGKQISVTIDGKIKSVWLLIRYGFWYFVSCSTFPILIIFADYCYKNNHKVIGDFIMYPIITIGSIILLLIIFCVFVMIPHGIKKIIQTWKNTD